MKKFFLILGIVITVLVVGLIAYSYVDYSSKQKRVAEATARVEDSCVKLISSLLEYHGLPSSLESLESQLSSDNFESFKSCQSNVPDWDVDVRSDKKEYKITYTNFEGESITKTFDPNGY